MDWGELTQQREPMTHHLLVDESGETQAMFRIDRSDPNHGVPAEWFREDIIMFETNGRDIEWWPPCGPAPHWRDQLTDGWHDRWLQWVRETF